MQTFKQLLGVIVAVFAFQSYAASIYDPGIQYCQSNPTLCGLENYGSFENGKNQGVSQCQQNPSSCNIIATDTNGSTADGISQCQRNPASCGLENSGSFENGKNQGISQCQQNPSSCGISTSSDTNGSTADGIAQCQNNPSSCGLENAGSFERGKYQGIQQGISQCQGNPLSCGILSSSDTNGSTADGIAQCQNNPSSCGLENAGSFERGKYQGIQQGISQCQGNPLSCKIPLAFIETKPRFSVVTNPTFDDPEIFVYLSSQGFTNDKQQIFDKGMNSSYVYQLISRQRRTSSDSYVFDLNTVNGLQ